MKFIKYIISILVLVALVQPVFAISKVKKDEEFGKKSTFSKKGNFKKDNTFNSKDVRAFGPPDPGGGGEGDPVPIDPAYGWLILSGFAFSFYLLKKRKSNS